MSEQRALQETRARYAVRLTGEKATFLWSSSLENPLKSSVDLRIETEPSEILWLAQKLGCQSRNGEVLASNLDAYNRLLVYTCVRPTVESPEKARGLATLILELNSWDALYWASRFRELWWTYGRYRRLLKVAKAFKLFFELE